MDTDRYKNAKAISSADLFGDEPDERGETPQSRLDKFSGSSAVGSADIFGDQSNSSAASASINVSAVRFDALFVLSRSKILLEGIQRRALPEIWEIWPEAHSALDGMHLTRSKTTTRSQLSINILEQCR